MGLHIILHNDDSYMDIEVKEGEIPTIDGTDVSTFTTKALPLADEKPFDILSRNQNFIPPELLSYFKQT